MVRTARERSVALALLSEGRSSIAAARLTGVPASTIREWARQPLDVTHRRDCPCASPAIGDAPAYAYLFGLYLGDGTVSRAGRTWRLRIFQDAGYPALVVEIASAMTRVVPERRVSVVTRGTDTGRGCAVVSSYARHWLCLFPQHGPGRKHERAIELVPWQQQIVDQHAELFIRGLLHSDGCRVTNKVGSRHYPRFLFSNRSADIRGILCRSLEHLGIPYRSSGHTISIATADGVARLDAFVPQKA